MCVIMASIPGKRIPEDWLRAGYESNSHGAGLAYRHKGQVHFKKGMFDIEEFLEAYREIPEGAPHVTHFRINSVGGICAELTHPFPLTDDASLATEGVTKGAVLFHNGHLHSWKARLEEMAQRSGGTIKIPVGPWSDTRAMAYLAARLGPGVLGFFDEKLVYLSPDRFDIYSGDHNKWTLRDQIHLSNTGWDHRIPRPNTSRQSSTSSSTSSSSASAEKEEHTSATSGNSSGGRLNTSSDTSTSQASEVTSPVSPFLLDPSLWPTPPRSVRTKGERKRWRKRMEEKGLLPSGPDRHRIRQARKYLEVEGSKERLLQMRQTN